MTTPILVLIAMGLFVVGFVWWMQRDDV